ncbi:hypothetical protein MAPG_07046, partial [Magnaporthiopsis poae ATCC 64411]
RGETRRAIVNSFGAHGGNTTLLLEDAPGHLRAENRSRAGDAGTTPRSFPFVVSAKSRASLKANVEALLRLLDSSSNDGDDDAAGGSNMLGDLSYTLCARRIHHPFRVITTADSLPALRQSLRASLDDEDKAASSPVPHTPPQVIMTFTGQGAFYAGGLGASLYRDSPVYRQEVQELDGLVQGHGFRSVLHHIQGHGDSQETATGQGVEEVVEPMVSQLAILVCELALARTWEKLGVTPSAVIGHSLGEYAAFVVAGVLSANDAILLVGRRAQLLAENCRAGSHLMLAVRASEEEVSACLSPAPSSSREPSSVMADSPEYEISCVNGPRSVVISGARQYITDVAQARLEAAGLRCTPLADLPYAFHSAQMDPVLPRLEELAGHAAFAAPRVPILSPLLRRCVFDAKTIGARYLARACREPVHFAGALQAAADVGLVAAAATLWLEVGPHPLCAGFVRAWDPTARSFASLRRDQDAVEAMTAAMAGLHQAGVAVSWQEHFGPHEKAYRLFRGLPAYQWNQKNYWIPYEGTFTLDKGLPAGERRTAATGLLRQNQAEISPLKTASVHRILWQEKKDGKASCEALLDLKGDARLLAAVDGHEMNGYGVATSAIWADLALTLGDYLADYGGLEQRRTLAMNLTDMQVLHAQVISRDASTPHLITARATLDVGARSASVQLLAHGEQEPFASCKILYEDPQAWTKEWSRVAHLVGGRIRVLEGEDRLNAVASTTATTTTTRLSRNMAYSVFENVVKYAEAFRGMRSVTLADSQPGEPVEAVATVRMCDLPPDQLP